MLTKDKKLQAQLFKSKEVQKNQKEQRAQSLLIQPQGEVVQEIEDDRTLLKINQDDLKKMVPIANAQNMFSLTLPKGPYKLSANPQNIYIAGKHGHVGVFGWRNKNLLCEIDVKSKVYDVHWVAQNNFALAQENAVYMYDDKGTEIHKIKDHKHPIFLEYLPYHYLLASVNKYGKLVYQDITQGQIIITYQTTASPLCLQQNPANAVLGIGDSMGVARLYTPNSGAPAISILCGKSGLNSIAFTRDGNYMVSGSSDGVVKGWDLRTCKQLSYDVTLPQSVSKVAISQKGIVAAATTTQVSFLQDMIYGSSYKLYMKHNARSVVQSMEFIDHEDFLALSTTDQFQSVLVPGSGDPNLDTYESYFYQTKKQQKESHVRSMLEKLQPQTIHINPHLIGTVDRASKEVLEKEKMMEQKLSQSKKIKKEKKKMRGRNSVKSRFLNKEKERDEQHKQKWQSILSDSVRVRRAEKQKKKFEMELLNQLEDLPVHQFVKAVKPKKKNLNFQQ